MLKLIKYFIVLLIISAQPFNSSAQIKISPYLFGENAWGPNQIFKVLPQIQDIHYQIIRIGGNGYENENFIHNDAIKLIDFVRSVGAEPILQIPRQLEDNDEAYQAIAFINGKMKRHVKFWSIGNEPDHHNQFASPEEVSDYFKKISSQIKRYDPKAKVIGFDLSSYKPEYLDRLLGGDLDVTGKIPGKNYFYLDVVSFHGYKFPDITKFELEVNALTLKLNHINDRRPIHQQLTWAITEFNSHWLVDPNLGEDYQPYNFHNGQIYAQVYDLGMRKGAFAICPWSMLEGGAHRTGTDLSLFDEQNIHYLPRSNYYHTLLLAQHYRKYYLNHSPNSRDIKILPMGDRHGLSIMIMNVSRTTPHHYSLNFEDNNNQKELDNIFINAEIKNAYQDVIDPETTQMLIFDSRGKLIKKWCYGKQQAEKMSPPICLK